MKLKRKSLRNQHIWFSVWNSKTVKNTPPNEEACQPVKVSNK